MYCPKIRDGNNNSSITRDEMPNINNSLKTKYECEQEIGMKITITQNFGDKICDFPLKELYVFSFSFHKYELINTMT